MRLENKVAAITGAAEGIGAAASELFAREGARVALIDRNGDGIAQLERRIREAGGQALAIVADVADSAQVRSAIQKISETYGALHVLYNNASIFKGREDASVDQVTEQTWRQILAINLDGLFFCSKYAIPLIIQSGGGTVIHTASSAAMIGIPGCDAYTASKGATVALTRSMAVEFGPRKIRVNCIAPAAIFTAMLRESSLDNPDFDEQRFLQTTPLRRYGTAAEIARVALFLASDESSYLNGAVIVADGGITIS